ncbi:Lrp/AsnC family transcriptional regulator [Microcella sp.]|uniref:Lrp/AsnC family transcriptional regulator n=1 Tax=Microcella sp. TaxID=1913979 RepID=UPI003F724FFB
MTARIRNDASIDETDARILGLLRERGRATNRQIAAQAGVAEATAHARVRGLEERGVIVGYEAVVSQRALGLDIQALIGVTLRPGARQTSIASFSAHVRSLTEVTQAFFVGGVDDFIVHVAVADSTELRRFIVDQMSGHASVASTRTSIIFEYTRNASASSFS